MKGVKKDPCDGCIHWKAAGVYRTCDYILDTQHRRPCPPGKCCTVKEGKRGKKMAKKQRTWDTERCKQLLQEGYTETQAAEMLGTTRAAINGWKQEQAKRTGEDLRQAEESNDDPVGPIPAPIPQDVPVTLRCGFGDCEVTLEAPNATEAVRCAEWLLKTAKWMSGGV